MRIVLTIFLIFFLSCPCLAKEMNSKKFQISPDNAFMISLKTLSKLNFEPVEIQSTSGYILFKTPARAEYLVIVSKISDIETNIKIDKMKNNSPLNEIREIFYTAFLNEMKDLPKKVEL